MRYTARQLNRATLERQLLLRRRRLAVAGAVRRVFAIQAQSPASPYVALWNRVIRFDPAKLDAAFRSRAIVKATLMRITLHAVHRDDWPALHGAMAPRLRTRVFDKRFLAGGMSADDAYALLEPLSEFVATARTNVEIDAHLRGLTGDESELGAWWALRAFAPVHHAPTGGPWSFGQRPSFRAADDVAADADLGVQAYVRRYLEAFGPAGVADAAQFSLLTRGTVRAALEALSDELVRHEGPDGAELWDLPDATVPGARTKAPPRLMAMWDSVLLAYADRSRVIPDDYRTHVIRQNGDTLPTLLVDGYVAGVWRPVDGGIEATAFHPLTDADWAGLADEARALAGFLADREPNVYGRYAYWWKSLPAAEVRVLGHE